MNRLVAPSIQTKAAPVRPPEEGYAPLKPSSGGSGVPFVKAAGGGGSKWKPSLRALLGTGREGGTSAKPRTALRMGGGGGGRPTKPDRLLAERVSKEGGEEEEEAGEVVTLWQKEQTRKLLLAFAAQSKDFRELLRARATLKAIRDPQEFERQETALEVGLQEAGCTLARFGEEAPQTQEAKDRVRERYETYVAAYRVRQSRNDENLLRLRQKLQEALEWASRNSSQGQQTLVALSTAAAFAAEEEENKLRLAVEKRDRLAERMARLEDALRESDRAAQEVAAVEASRKEAVERSLRLGEEMVVVRMKLAAVKEALTQSHERRADAIRRELQAIGERYPNLRRSVEDFASKAPDLLKREDAERVKNAADATPGPSGRRVKKLVRHLLDAFSRQRKSTRLLARFAAGTFPVSGGAAPTGETGDEEGSVGPTLGRGRLGASQTQEAIVKELVLLAAEDERERQRLPHVVKKLQKKLAAQSGKSLELGLARTELAEARARVAFLEEARSSLETRLEEQEAREREAVALRDARLAERDDQIAQLKERLAQAELRAEASAGEGRVEAAQAVRQALEAMQIRFDARLQETKLENAKLLRAARDDADARVAAAAAAASRASGADAVEATAKVEELRAELELSLKVAEEALALERSRNEALTEKMRVMKEAAEEDERRIRRERSRAEQAEQALAPLRQAAKDAEERALRKASEIAALSARYEGEIAALREQLQTAQNEIGQAAAGAIQAAATAKREAESLAAETFGAEREILRQTIASLQSEKAALLLQHQNATSASEEARERTWVETVARARAEAREEAQAEARAEAQAEARTREEASRAREAAEAVESEKRVRRAVEEALAGYEAQSRAESERRETEIRALEERIERSNGKLLDAAETEKDLRGQLAAAEAAEQEAQRQIQRAKEDAALASREAERAGRAQTSEEIQRIREEGALEMERRVAEARKEIQDRLERSAAEAMKEAKTEAARLLQEARQKIERLEADRLRADVVLRAAEEQASSRILEAEQKAVQRTALEVAAAEERVRQRLNREIRERVTFAEEQGKEQTLAAVAQAERQGKERLAQVEAAQRQNIAALGNAVGEMRKQVEASLGRFREQEVRLREALRLEQARSEAMERKAQELNQQLAAAKGGLAEGQRRFTGAVARIRAAEEEIRRIGLERDKLGQMFQGQKQATDRAVAGLVMFDAKLKEANAEGVRLKQNLERSRANEALLHKALMGLAADADKAIGLEREDLKQVRAQAAAGGRAILEGFGKLQNRYKELSEQEAQRRDQQLANLKQELEQKLVRAQQEAEKIRQEQAQKVQSLQEELRQKDQAATAAQAKYEAETQRQKREADAQLRSLADEYHRTIQSVQQATAKAEAETDRLRQSLESERSKFDEAQRAALTAQTALLAKEATAQDEIAQLKRELRDRKEEQGTLQSNLQKAQKELEASKKEVAALQKQPRDATTENALAQVTAEKDQWMATVKELRQQASAASSAAASTEKELREQIQALQTQTATSETRQAEALRIQTEALAAANRKSEQDLADLRQKLESAQKELLGAKSAAAEESATLQKTQKTALLALQRDLETARQLQQNAEKALQQTKEVASKALVEDQTKKWRQGEAAKHQEEIQKQAALKAEQERVQLEHLKTLQALKNEHAEALERALRENTARVLEDEAKKVAAEGDQLRAQLNTESEKVTKATEEISRLRAELKKVSETTRADVESLTAALKAVSEESPLELSKDVQARFPAVQTVLNSIQARREKLNADALQATTTLEKMEKDKQVAEKERDEALNQVADLRAQITQLQPAPNTQEENQRLQDQVTKLKAQLKESLEEAAKAKDATLQIQKEERERLEKIADDKTSKLLQELEEARKKTNAAEMAQREAERQRNELQEEKRRLDLEVLALQAPKDETKLQTENAALRAEKTRLEGELRQALDAAKPSSRGLQHRRITTAAAEPAPAEASKLDPKELQTQLNSEREHAAKAILQKKAMEAEVLDLKKQKAALEQKVKEQEARSEATAKEVEKRLEAEKEEIAAQLVAAQKEASVAASKIEGLEKAVESSQSEITQLRGTVAEQQQNLVDLAGLQERLKALEAENLKLREQLGLRDQQIKELLEGQNTAVEAFDATRLELEGKIRTLEQANTDLTVEYNLKLDGVKATYSKWLEESKEKNTLLRQELDRIGVSAAEYDARKAALDAEYGNRVAQLEEEYGKKTANLEEEYGRKTAELEKLRGELETLQVATAASKAAKGEATVERRAAEKILLDIRSQVANEKKLREKNEELQNALKEQQLKLQQDQDALGEQQLKLQQDQDALGEQQWKLQQDQDALDKEWESLKEDVRKNEAWREALDEKEALNEQRETSLKERGAQLNERVRKAEAKANKKEEELGAKEAALRQREEVLERETSLKTRSTEAPVVPMTVAEEEEEEEEEVVEDLEAARLREELRVARASHAVEKANLVRAGQDLQAELQRWRDKGAALAEEQAKQIYNQQWLAEQKRLLEIDRVEIAAKLAHAKEDAEKAAEKRKEFEDLVARQQSATYLLEQKAKAATPASAVGLEKSESGRVSLVNSLAILENSLAELSIFGRKEEADAFREGERTPAYKLVPKPKIWSDLENLVSNVASEIQKLKLDLQNENYARAAQYAAKAEQLKTSTRGTIEDFYWSKAPGVAGRSAAEESYIKNLLATINAQNAQLLKEKTEVGVALQEERAILAEKFQHLWTFAFGEAPTAFTWTVDNFEQLKTQLTTKILQLQNENKEAQRKLEEAQLSGEKQAVLLASHQTELERVTRANSLEIATQKATVRRLLEERQRLDLEQTGAVNAALQLKEDVAHLQAVNNTLRLGTEERVTGLLAQLEATRLRAMEKESELQRQTGVYAEFLGGMQAEGIGGRTAAGAWDLGSFKNDLQNMSRNLQTAKAAEFTAQNQLAALYVTANQVRQNTTQWLRNFQHILSDAVFKDAEARLPRDSALRKYLVDARSFGQSLVGLSSMPEQAGVPRSLDKILDEIQNLFAGTPRGEALAKLRPRASEETRRTSWT